MPLKIKVKMPKISLEKAMKQINNLVKKGIETHVDTLIKYERIGRNVPTRRQRRERRRQKNAERMAAFYAPYDGYLKKQRQGLI